MDYHFKRCLEKKNLFVDKNLLEASFLDDYDMAKDLCENADYKSNFSQTSAEQLINKAQQFLDKTKKLLEL